MIGKNDIGSSVDYGITFTAVYRGSDSTPDPAVPCVKYESSSLRDNQVRVHCGTGSGDLYGFYYTLIGK